MAQRDPNQRVAGTLMTDWPTVALGADGIAQGARWEPRMREMLGTI
jgi:hypothetical protein